MLSCGASASVLTNLAYAPAPLDNPLKGIAANYSVTGPALASFPHSLNTKGFPLNALMSGPTNFDWSTFESFLNTVTNDGSQTIPLFYIDYPQTTTNSFVPDYVLTNGLQTWVYQFEGANGLFPDYENTNLQQCLTDFITALGAKYDGDPRIAFVRMGIIGVYGEWHYGPAAMLSHWASISAQRKVMDAYTNAFTKTKLMVRYPAGTNNDAGGVATASNHNYPVGYHDDSFCRTTVPTNYPANSTVPNWFQLSEMTVSTSTNHWKTYPMGGELSLSLYTGAFSNSPIVSPADFGTDQTWSNAVFMSHSTWIHEWAAFFEKHLYGSGSYDFGPGGTNALLGARELGYELYVQSCSFWTNGTSLVVSATITNTGIAPFYYPWTVQLLATNTTAHTSATTNTTWDISAIVPGDGSQTFTATLTNMPANPFTVVMHAVNPMATGKQLRFANVNQDATVANWVTLGALDSNSDLSPPGNISAASLSVGKAIFGP